MPQRYRLDFSEAVPQHLMSLPLLWMVQRITVPLMTSHFRLSVKDKGRTVLPVALQRECGFGPGVDLFARPLGAGRFVVETADAVLDRIWEGLPASEGDAVAELSSWRTESGRSRMAALSSEPDADDSDSDAPCRCGLAQSW